MGMADYGASNTIATIGGIIGAALSAGDKPKVPDFVPLNTGKAQSDATKANIANFGDISALAGETNRFNSQQIVEMLSKVAPDWQSVVSKQRSLIDSELSGQIPQDVQDLIKSSSAGRSVGMGTAGSPFGRNLTARDLGLTSLDLTTRGFSHAEQWLASAKSRIPEPFNAASMFISPAMQLQAQQFNNQGQFQHDWMQNLITAAPDPFLAGVGNAIAQGAGGASTQWQFGNMMNQGNPGTGAGFGQGFTPGMPDYGGNVMNGPYGGYSSNYTPSGFTPDYTGSWQGSGVSGASDNLNLQDFSSMMG